jgi:mono/diheme cytochrome c family protein
MRELHGHRRLLLSLLALAPLACLAQGAPAVPAAQSSVLLERGRYLATLADCAACHEDPQSHEPFAGGRPLQTPFGMLVAPNITPDPSTGIGRWSDAQFEAAVRFGRMPGGARLYPAMPYVYYSRMSHDDALAIRAYLATVTPVHHAVLADQLPFPFNSRAIMRVWDLLFFHPKPWQTDPSRSAAWNRGAWIVEGPGHCEACHTPKGRLGEDLHARALKGYLTQGWFAPDISTDAQRGIAHWSREDIVQLLRNGHNRLAAASGPMGEEIEDSSSRLTDADLASIAEYLGAPAQSIQAVQTTAAPSDIVAAHNPRLRAGAAIYQGLCSACHGPDGRGVPYLFPDLTADNAVEALDPSSLLLVVLIGTRTVATNAEPTAPAMPGYRWQLSDGQIASVLTYVRTRFGQSAGPVSVAQVHKARQALE